MTRKWWIAFVYEKNGQVSGGERAQKYVEIVISAPTGNGFVRLCRRVAPWRSVNEMLRIFRWIDDFLKKQETKRGGQT